MTTGSLLVLCAMDIVFVLEWHDSMLTSWALVLSRSASSMLTSERRMKLVEN